MVGWSPWLQASRWQSLGSYGYLENKPTDERYIYMSLLFPLLCLSKGRKERERKKKERERETNREKKEGKERDKEKKKEKGLI